MSSTPPTERSEPLPASPAAPDEARRGDGPARTPWLREVVLAAIIAAVGAIVAWGLGFLPNPFDDTQPEGTVTIGQTQRNQTLGMFRGETLEPRPGELLGLTLDVARSGDHVTTNGCRLVWTILNADGPTNVNDPSLVLQDAEHVSPDPSSCVTQTRLWVPLAASLAPYERIAVRVELYAGGHLLSSAVSETIPLG